MRENFQCVMLFQQRVLSLIDLHQSQIGTSKSEMYAEENVEWAFVRFGFCICQISTTRKKELNQHRAYKQPEIRATTNA
jgi:hypothetical protein